VRPPGCGSLGGPAPAVPAPAGARSCRSTATAIADPRVSLVRPTPRDLGVASGPPLSRGQALANRRLAPRPRPPNPLRRACPREGGGLILRQFPQTAPDRAWRHAGRHRHRGNATISDGKRLRRGDQATTPFIKKGRHRQKPLSNGLDIDHNYHIWYEKMVVNSIFTLSEVDSIISGRALTVALQTVTRLIEQVADQGAADLVTLGLQRLRQPAHAFAGPPQRRFRVTPRRRLDQRLEIVKQRVVLGDRSPASSSRLPNALRGLVRRQFLQAPSDGARRNPGRHRDRRYPAITRGKRLRGRNQTPAAFIEKGRHRRKPLSNGFDIDHHHNIWYGKSVVNPYLTLSKVDSIISGRALRWSPAPRKRDRAGAGHETDTEEAQRGVQSEGGAGCDQGRPDGRRASSGFT